MNDKIKQHKTDQVEAREWVQSILIAIVLAFVLKFFIVDFVRVDGSSMYPTLQNNNRVIVSKVNYYFTDPDYGDIVILAYDKNTEYVKRIIGKGGDTIEIIDNVVYRNGEALDEPYINTEDYPDFAKVTVPEGEYFVMGDNRAHSSDSRYVDLGFVERSQIDGKVIFRFWPLNEFGTVE